MELNIPIRPTSSIYATYRRLSYKPWFAIAEFVDNSTQSYFNNRQLLNEVFKMEGVGQLQVEINYNSVENTLEIVDNAYGMEHADFFRAVILDSPPPNTSGRSEFGMGLKTAACWFGAKWTVESTQLGSDKIYNATIDVRQLAESRADSIQGFTTGTKFALISGIVDRLNELEQNTYLERMLETDTAKNIDLVKEMQKNQLICIRMPEWAFPTDGEKDIICTYWMTKLWLALQIRGHQMTREKATKVNLVIDELYQVRTTQNMLSEKLSRLAKFGLNPIISCHYLNQIIGIRDELRSANASYMLISGVDKKNYSELQSELAPYQEEDLLRLPRYHSLNLIKNKDGYARFITKLPPPI